LALADVHAFVVARAREGLGVHAEDDVTERHGGGAAGHPERGAAVEEQGGEAAVQFEDAVDPLRPATTGEEGGDEEEEADARRGKGPEVNEGAQRSHERMIRHQRYWARPS